MSTPLLSISDQSLHKQRAAEFRRLAQEAVRRYDDSMLLLQKIGARFTRESPDISNVVYKLFRTEGYEDLGEDWGPIAWEAPVTFTVSISGKEALGMACEYQEEALCIRQLQGVAGVNVPLKLHTWPKLFLESCVEFALKQCLPELRIYKACESIYYKNPIIPLESPAEMVCRITEHQQRMRRRYDGTARQLKFKKSDHYYFWTHPEYLGR